MLFHVFGRLHSELTLEALGEIGRSVETYGVADLVYPAAALGKHSRRDVETLRADVVVRGRPEKSLSLTDEGGFAQAQSLGKLVVAELGVGEIFHDEAVNLREKFFVAGGDVEILLVHLLSRHVCGLESLPLPGNHLKGTEQIVETERLLDVEARTALHAGNFRLGR